MASTYNGASGNYLESGIIFDGVYTGTIKNGTVTSKNSTGIYAADGYSLTIENCTATTSSEGSSPDPYKSAVRVTENSTVTINSGTFTGYNAINLECSGASVTINGGAFTGRILLHYLQNPNHAYLNISGGTFNGNLVFDGSDQQYVHVTITGGTFSFDPSSYLTDDYMAYESGDNEWTVVAKTKVCKIGDEYCTSLAEAFTKVNPGETITLTSNCETGSSYTENNPLALTTANVTLDLNGYTITETKNFSFVIAGNNDVVKNGTINSSDNSGKACGYNSYALVVANLKEGATTTGVVIDGVTFKGGISVGGSLDGNETQIRGSSVATLRNCSVTSGDWYAICTQIASTANIESGTYDINSIDPGSKQTYRAVFSNGSSCTISITGGTFGANPSTYVASGYEAVTSGSKWIVIPSGKVARIGDTYYNTFDLATSAAVNGDKIELLKDLDLGSGYLNINGNGKYIDVDLGGHTITTTGTWGVFIKGNMKSLTNGTINANNIAVALGVYNDTNLDELNINANSAECAIMNGYHATSYTANIGEISGGNYVAVWNSALKLTGYGLKNGTHGTIGEISGGTFQGVGCAFNNYGVISSITGGEFCARLIYQTKRTDTQADILLVSGGDTYTDVWAGTQPVSITGGKWANQGKKSGGCTLTPDAGYQLYQGGVDYNWTGKTFYSMTTGPVYTDRTGTYYWYDVVNNPV